ncbi:MAG: PAS domain-containing sensor histidine kinase [Bacteroidota bacterium]|nr:PAS domain-containing sensor histidine kinase [Bacteroidota bacterium]
MNKLLLREQGKFEAVFQNASLGILVIDKSGTITLANNFLITLFGYSNSDELIGKKLEMLIPKRYHHRHVSDRDHFIKHPTTRPMGMGRDLFGITQDGTELPLEISLSSYTNDEEIFSIAFISDIRARIEVQNALNSQRIELAAINKKMELLNEELEKKVERRTAKLQETMQELEASKDVLSKALNTEKDLGDLKSAFVSMASHEFRTPLSTILSSVSLLAKYRLTEEQTKRDKHVQRIKSSVINLNNILDEFLSLGKIEDKKITAHKTVFDIKKFILQQINEMNEILKPGQKVYYSHTGSPYISLDEVLFKNIMINLLSNASKFSNENNAINIVTKADEKELLFTIKDEGIGISEKDQEHLCEIFFRAANAENIPGTGLGLHIVCKYVEMMKGKIEIKSKLEKGTEINLIFAQ